jgi:hypothetical protein
MNKRSMLRSEDGVHAERSTAEYRRHCEKFRAKGIGPDQGEDNYAPYHASDIS